MLSSLCEILLIFRRKTTYEETFERDSLQLSNISISYVSHVLHLNVTLIEFWSDFLMVISKDEKLYMSI